MSNNHMGLTNDEVLRYWKYISIGMEAGKKQLADYIQYHLEIGKPVEINGIVLVKGDETEFTGYHG